MNFTSSEASAKPFAPSFDSVVTRLERARVVERVEDAFPHLHWTDICIHARAEPLFEDIPDLADRIRGGLGRALERLRETHGYVEDTCDAWELLFGGRLPRRIGSEFRPFLIQAERHGSEIKLLVRLFGFADCWTLDIAKACVDALGRGIAIKSSGRVRVKLHPYSATSHRYWWTPTIPFSKRALVTVVTPLILRSGVATNGSLAGLWNSSLRRFQSLGMWCGVSIDITASLANQRWQIHDVNLIPARWRRHSTTHPEGQEHTGLLGSLVISEASELSFSVLQLLEVMHAGGRSSSGYGQVQIG